jgi:glycosyltransferase involved in cell wall biosynthesis
MDPSLKNCLRLALIGGGPLLAECRQLLMDAGVIDLAWLPGERGDIPGIMRGLDCFVLPSLAEGVSNTILEAMSSGLPVIATDVGGNAELVSAGVTGYIIPATNPEAMAEKIVLLANRRDIAHDMGRAGRDLVERKFSMNAMVAAYQDLYDKLLYLGHRSDSRH